MLRGYIYRYTHYSITSPLLDITVTVVINIIILNINYSFSIIISELPGQSLSLYGPSYGVRSVEHSAHRDRA